MLLGMPWYLGNSRPLMMSGDWNSWLSWGIIPIAIWSALWTGMALWHAAKRDQKGWFIVFLFIHTAGILEILYLVFVAKAFTKEKKHKAVTHRRRR